VMCAVVFVAGAKANNVQITRTSQHLQLTHTHA